MTTSRRLRGRVVSYNKERGFGFVQVGDERYFLHATQLPGNVDREGLAGREVTFLPGETAKGQQAYKVKMVEEVDDEETA